MGRLAEMQRKLLEVCVMKLWLRQFIDLVPANDGSGGYGSRERELGLVGRESLP